MASGAMPYAQGPNVAAILAAGRPGCGRLAAPHHLHLFRLEASMAPVIFQRDNANSLSQLALFRGRFRSARGPLPLYFPNFRDPRPRPERGPCESMTDRLCAAARALRR